MVTEHQIEAGIVAAEAYEGWQSSMIGHDNNRKIVECILNAADKAKPTPVERQMAAFHALRAAADASGYGNMVNNTMVNGIVVAVLSAAEKV